jgi:hypothetical protein
MLLDTRSKNIHGLGVGISTVFEIFGHLLYQGGTESLRMVILKLHTIICYLRQETRIYMHMV